MATLKELNDLLGGDLAGDGGLKITGAGSLDDAGPGDLAPLDSAAHLEAARGSKAGVFLVDASLEAEFRRPVIRVKGVLLAFNRVIEALGLLPAVLWSIGGMCIRRQLPRSRA